MNWLALFNQVRDIAIVGGLGYFLKLMHQRNEMLAAEKLSLKQTEIDLHKANIGHLRSLQAPAIASQLDQMIRTADRFAEEKQKLEQKVELLVAKALEAESAEEPAVATVEEVKEFISKAYLFGLPEASFEAAATATEKLGEWPGLQPYKSNLIRVGEEALDGKPLEPTRLGEFSILGSRPEWWKIQNPPTEFKATKQGGTPSDPEPDPDF